MTENVSDKALQRMLFTSKTNRPTAWVGGSISMNAQLMRIYCSAVARRNNSSTPVARWSQPRQSVTDCNGERADERTVGLSVGGAGGTADGRLGRRANRRPGERAGERSDGRAAMI